MSTSGPSNITESTVLGNILHKGYESDTVCCTVLKRTPSYLQSETKNNMSTPVLRPFAASLLANCMTPTRLCIGTTLCTSGTEMYTTRPKRDRSGEQGQTQEGHLFQAEASCFGQHHVDPGCSRQCNCTVEPEGPRASQGPCQDEEGLRDNGVSSPVCRCSRAPCQPPDLRQHPPCISIAFSRLYNRPAL